MVRDTLPKNKTEQTKVEYPRWTTTSFKSWDNDSIVDELNSRIAVDNNAFNHDKAFHVNIIEESINFYVIEHNVDVRDDDTDDEDNCERVDVDRRATRSTVDEGDDEDEIVFVSKDPSSIEQDDNRFEETQSFGGTTLTEHSSYSDTISIDNFLTTVFQCPASRRSSDSGENEKNLNRYEARREMSYPQNLVYNGSNENRSKRDDISSSFSAPRRTKRRNILAENAYSNARQPDSVIEINDSIDNSSCQSLAVGDVTTINGHENDVHHECRDVAVSDLSEKVIMKVDNENVGTHESHGGSTLNDSVCFQTTVITKTSTIPHHSLHWNAIASPRRTDVVWDETTLADNTPPIARLRYYRNTLDGYRMLV